MSGYFGEGYFTGGYFPEGYFPGAGAGGDEEVIIGLRFPAWLKEVDNLAKRASIAITNPTDTAKYPAANLIRLPVSKPARLNNRGSNQIYVTFAGATSCDFMALVAHNLTSESTILLHAGATFQATTVNEVVTWRKGTAFIYLSAAESYKYWTIDIEDTDNPNGFLEVGYLVLGNLTKADFTHQPEWSYGDRSIYVGSEFATGTPDIRQLVERQDMALMFASLDTADADTLRALVRDCRHSEKPLFFIPDTEVNEGLFGRFTEDRFERSFINPNIQDCELLLVEDPPGLISQAPMPIVRAGDDLPADYTFSRTGTALYKNQDLALVEAATGVLREEHYFEDGVFGILLEAARTNAWSYSEDLTNAVWIKGACTITSNAADEPLAVPTGNMDEIVETADDFPHGIERETGALTADTLQATSFFAKANTRSWVWIRTVNKATTTADSWINLSTGAKGTVDAGHEILVEKYVDGIWRIQVSWDSGTGGTSPYVWVKLATADTVTNYLGDGISGAYVWGLQHEVDKPFPSSYKGDTGAGTLTTNTETLYIPFDFDAQPMTVYAKIVHIDVTDGTTGKGLWHIGSSSYGTDPRLELRFTVADMDPRVEYDDDATVITKYESSGIPDPGDIWEIRAILQPDGKVAIGHSINAAAENVSAASATGNTFPGAFAADQLHLNCRGGETGKQVSLFLELKAYRGVQTLDFMRAL